MSDKTQGNACSVTTLKEIREKYGQSSDLYKRWKKACDSLKSLKNRI